MPRLKRLSGAEVIAAFHRLGFATISQRGSHVKLRRIAVAGNKETLTIPLHQELDLGTLRAIVRQAGRYLSESEIAGVFYAQE
jgi:predicted RNA binding protein YcfA (HicA-like mRNA interferase family)